MNDPFGATLPDRHVQRREHQLGTKMMGHGPPDHLAAEHVEHDGQVYESGPGRDIGDVGDPQAIGRIGLKLTLDPVRSRVVAAVRARGARAAAPAHPGQARTLASAGRRACARLAIRGFAAPHAPEAPHRCLAIRGGWPRWCCAAPRLGGHVENALGLATRSTRWGRRPTPGTSWPPHGGPGSPSRARRPPRYRTGLPSEPGRGFF